MKHLPDHAKAALATDFGISPDTLIFLGGGEDWSDGTVFRYPCTDSPSGQRVLKILSLEDSDDDDWHRAAERLDAVTWLGEQGCPVVTPRRLPDGSVFRQRQEEGWRYLAYTYDMAPGRHIQDEPCARSGGFYRACGEVMGRMHAAWERRGEAVHADGSSTVHPHMGFWSQEMDMFREWCDEEAVRNAWDHLKQALSGLSMTPGTYGFVHNDAHVWNMLFDPETIPPGTDGTPRAGEPALSLLDFDCAGMHWYLNDCAVTLYSFVIMRSPGIEKPPLPPEDYRIWAFDRFWEGYRRHRPVEASWLQDLDLFLQYRRCLLFMPFQTETASKPKWRKAWIDAIVRADRELFGG